MQISATYRGCATGLLALACLSATLAANAGAQAGRAESTLQGRLPFGVGERAVYDGKYGFLHAGSASATIEAVDTVRGHTVWRSVLKVDGGFGPASVHDRYTSWFDPATMVSYQYYQHIADPGYKRERKFAIEPESGIAILEPGDTLVTVSQPLDDGSFLFFVRTLPLAVGQVYTFNRYFRPDGNPVEIRVVGIDTVSVPAGQYVCFVVTPVIRSRGLFGEGGHAKVWISDDPLHLVVQIRVGLKIGSLSLYLKSYTPAPTP